MNLDAILLIRYDQSLRAASRLRGELGDKWYANAIGINSFDFSPESGGIDLDEGRGAKADTSFGPVGFKIAKAVDRASPHLFRGYTLTFSKRKVPKLNFFERADLIFRKGGAAQPLEYVTLVFTGVIVASYSMSVNDDGEGKETVGFRFQTCQMSYREQLPDGTLTTAPEMKGWSYITNKRL